MQVSVKTSFLAPQTDTEFASVRLLYWHVDHNLEIDSTSWVTGLDYVVQFKQVHSSSKLI